MKIVWVLTLGVLMHICFLSSVSYAQNEDSESRNEIFISFVKSQFVKENYATIGTTRSIPPNTIKALDGWTYLIDLEIKVDGKNFVWASPVEITFTLPDRSQHKEIINNHASLLNSGNIYKFSFYIEIKRKGLITIEMNPLKDRDNDPVPDVKFIGNSVFIE